MERERKLFDLLFRKEIIGRDFTNEIRYTRPSSTPKSTLRPENACFLRKEDRSIQNVEMVSSQSGHFLPPPPLPPTPRKDTSARNSHNMMYT